jgi:hypothetical protein
MNTQQIRQFIEDYKRNFNIVHEQEIYKWKAVKCFQENWDLKAKNFPQMLESSLSATVNLLNSGQYFPQKMLLGNSRIDPIPIKKLFINLFDETKDLIDRIQSYKSNFKKINQKNFPGKNGYQDPRAILVYLSLRYPDKYFLYKFEIFKSFSQIIDFNYKPIKGRIGNIGEFENLCELIRFELIKDQVLLKLHKERITDDCYFDKSYNILTQDFIYSVVTHLQGGLTIKNKKTHKAKKVDSLSLDTFKSKGFGIDFKPSMTDYIQREIENKRIGDLGEKWVINYETNKLKKIGKHKLAERVEHYSKEKGDGSGFDIKSFNEFGKEIFIEVKTTIGKISTPFFITLQELERSKIEKKKYFLYRLYNLNEEMDECDLVIINGELTNLCTFPWTFKSKI